MQLCSCCHVILHHFTVTKDITVYKLFKEALTELLAILDSFHLYHKWRVLGWGWWGAMAVAAKIHVRKLEFPMALNTLLVNYCYGLSHIP